MAMIFFGSSISAVPSAVGAIPDTLLHSVEYGGLALVSLRAAAGGRWSRVTLATLSAAWLITTIYGATDEWHQVFTPGRMPELRDLRNDAVGAALALALAWAWGTMNRSSQAR
ncbi:MAG: VanZ family protein [Vicinamibacterales bacterium]